MRIRPVGAEFFHGDERTVRHDEANRSFPLLCRHAKKATKNEINNPSQEK